MIAIDRLTFGYPESEFRLAIPELRVAPGEKLAVIGPSGSGKTTLLNLVSGILTPNKGTLRVAETEVSALSDARRRDFRIRTIGFVFQDFELLFDCVDAHGATLLVVTHDHELLPRFNRMVDSAEFLPGFVSPPREDDAPSPRSIPDRPAGAQIRSRRIGPQRGEGE